MTLFHGSYLKVPAPDVKLGRAAVDFGQGFYLTRYQDQASSWALAVSKRHRGAVPTINTYEFDIDLAKAMSGPRYKVFSSYDLEWLNYVVDCRKRGSLQSQYDVIEGGVANDNVIDTVELYENGDITAEQALGQLVYKKVNHQLTILNQDIVDSCLRFVGCEEVHDAP